MGNHKHVSVYINSHKLHTTGCFNDLFEEEIDQGKFPHEMSHGCTYDQIIAAISCNPDIQKLGNIIVSLRFYKRHASNRNCRTWYRSVIYIYYFKIKKVDNGMQNIIFGKPKKLVDNTHRRIQYKNQHDMWLN